ncbi:DUF1735 and LamG domain-containing protein [Bacteroides finegoldii]|uniref:DUF1735 and LamG domain-containing protein n=1 Tax=Bacteroides finegoldii TaxID=338188 RepID=UPI00189A52A7|nr:DUF1735 and LamG domain-containing protein [Bacteroides finegoldii]
MKLNILLLGVLCLAFSLVGCTENDENFDNKLFISTSVFTEDVLFKAGMPNQVSDISVAIAKPEDHEIKVTIAPDPALLETYKLTYYEEDVELLPEEFYSMEETTTVINAGSIASTSLPVTFVNIGNLDINKVYVLPVTIRSVEGVDVLQSAKTYYYVFRAASLVNVVATMTRNRAYPDFNNDPKFNNLSQNTMEILFKANSFSNGISTLMGIEQYYLLRLGDSEPSNQLQIASKTINVSNSELQFESGVWYHLAVVFDGGYVTVYVNGVEKLSRGRVDISSVNLGAKHHNEEDGRRVFWIGYSYEAQRYFDGVVAEARIWNRALTAEEIKAPNHFYFVDPASDGLIAYWKFDEGAGTKVIDYASGYDLTFDNEPVWVPVSLPEKK